MKPTHTGVFAFHDRPREAGEPVKDLLPAENQQIHDLFKVLVNALSPPELRISYRMQTAKLIREPETSFPTDQLHLGLMINGPMQMKQDALQERKGLLTRVAELFLMRFPLRHYGSINFGTQNVTPARGVNAQKFRTAHQKVEAMLKFQQIFGDQALRDRAHDQQFQGDPKQKDMAL